MEAITTDKPSLLKVVTELKKLNDTFYVYPAIDGNWIITDHQFRANGELMKPEVIVYAVN